MSRWTDNFEKRDYIGKLAKLVGLLENLKTDGFDAQQMADVARLLKVTVFLREWAVTTDPEMLGARMWEQTTPHFDSFQTAVVNFCNSRNFQHLTTATSSADELLNWFWTVTRVSSPESLKALADATNTYQKKVTEHIEEMRALVESSKSEVKSLKETVTQVKGRLDENGKIIEQQKKRLDDAIAAFQKQFSDNEATRAKTFSTVSQKYNEDFNSALSKLREEIATLRANEQKTFDEFHASLNRKSDEHLSFLKQREEDVKRIFNVIGNTSVAGDYKNTADREAKSANWLRGFAITFMLAMVAIAGLAFHYSLSHADFDWRMFAFRFATSVIFLIPAVYCAQESAKHRRREAQNRKLHLELASIDAYLELLPPDQKTNIKAKLTEKFFGTQEPQDKEETITKHMLFELVSDILKTATKGK